MEQEKQIKNLESALEFVASMQKADSFNEINHNLFSQSLKILADRNKEKSFKLIVDKYIELAKNSGEKMLREKPYSFLDFICQGMDHGYTYSHVNQDKEIEMGNAQKLLHKLYF
jgi:hypothetical protein